MKLLETLFPLYTRKIALLWVMGLLSLSLFISLNQQNPANTNNPFHTTIVLDVSLSMNVLDGDMSSSTRLDASKRKIEEIVAYLPHDFWLTVFSGDAQRVIPHTADTSLFLTFLSGVDRENVSEGGTDILWALADASNDFLEENTWNIIVFTDGGEENLENIQEVWKELEEKGIQLFIVGVGSKQGGNIPYARDAFGRVLYKTYNWERVVSELNEKALQSLTRKLGWEYIHLPDLQNLSTFDTWVWGGNQSKFSFSQLLIVLSLASVFWMYFLAHIVIYKYYNIPVWKK